MYVSLDFLMVIKFTHPQVPPHVTIKESEMGKNNWSFYNKSLVNRGQITFWFSPDIVKSWYAKPTGQQGGQLIYSDTAIEVLNIIRFRFGLKLRCTQGFAQSLVQLMGLDIKTPNYTTLCRRLKKLSLQIHNKVYSKKGIHVVIDSTGLKVYGEGEWKVRQHGYSKRRTWKKLHLAVDESNSQIKSVVLSDNSFKDNELFEDLLTGIEDRISQVSADGAYDSKESYKICKDKGIKFVVPPRKNAVIERHGNSHDPPLLRDTHIREIRKIGRKKWKEKHKYHRRSISETAMYRFKTLLGDKLSSREFQRQANEVFIKCKILNQMAVPTALSS